MGKNLLAKAGLVLAPRGPITPGSHATNREEGTKPKTAIGAMAQFTDRQSSAIKEASQLKEQMKEFEGSLPTKRLDPKLITRSRWANRHDLSFVGPEFDGLKEDIGAQGGNVQPIKVRRLKGTDKFEIIFGHRRHQACLELGLGVLAIIEDLDDKHLFIEMDRENRQRKDLRPYEIGAMYALALDEGLFPSGRRLAEEVGIDQSQLTKALSLARLPADVLKSFVSPLDLQYRWVSDLNDALQKDPEHVLRIAKEVILEEPRPISAEVFKRLTAMRGTVPHPVTKAEKVEGKGGQKGKLVFNAKDRSVRIDLFNIDPARFSEVKETLRKLLS
ncbi:MAG: ParB/RepB/Spo0J family partition protein [Burkholderiaceae bacterium]|uniref:ParB/RepB/Spo0J family partition protein n=1 Tax=Rhodoferax sp. TaxID=50421 RepID=UPI001ED5CDD5|nr:ParB/RepB/Spo0J family partition protein [Rhodoferax sp.]MBT9505026.1 ParB/RepB/Spo0J family partition protein [Rhodoferax sp.]MDO8767698.1 ParB/RepB/Spo0J family partition protein [Burkholderiaceae bacterium]